MLTKRLIACLDVTDGRVVKGINFVDLKDAGDPIEIAKKYNDQGIDELTFLDITATSDNRDLILPIIENVAKQVFIPLTVGGGVRTIEDVRRLLNAGADKVSFNSAAIQNPQIIKDASSKYGNQCIVIAIDAKKNNQDNKNSWNVYSHGGRKDTEIDVIEWSRKIAEFGAGEILLTSMDCDGTKNGFDLELTKIVSQSVDIPVIASGGAGNLQHLADALTLGQADAVLAASIFHYGEFTIQQAKEFLKKQNIFIR